MGRKKTYVGTSVSRVIEDNRQPDSVKAGLLAALHSNGDIVDNVLDHLIGSIGNKAQKLYDFAKDGHYIHGLPAGTEVTPGEGLVDLMTPILTALHGAPAAIDYLYYGPPNNLHIAWMGLTQTHNYNSDTNIIGSLETTLSTPVYLNDMVLRIPTAQVGVIDPRSLRQWGISPKAGKTVNRAELSLAVRKIIPHSPVEVDDEGTGYEYARVKYQWVFENAIIDQYFDIPITGYDDNANYIHIGYQVGTRYHYFIYKVGSGTYPGVDYLFDEGASSSGEYFPFIYFRFGKVSENSNTASESYKDNKKLLKFLGMDYDTICEGINENPDIADIEQAMMMFAVPANTENEQERRYLWDFFNRMFLAQSPENRFKYEASADIRIGLTDLSLPSVGTVIQDARFKMSLHNDGIYKVRKAGTIGAVGKHTSGVSSFNFVTMTYQTVAVSESENVIVEVPVSTPISYHYYRRQIVEGIYDEIQVVELETLFHIIPGYATLGDDDDKILLIPLDHSITQAYSLPDREILYSRAMHYVFNSLSVVKAKWYETGLFKAIILVVAVVITIYTWGADGGSAIAAALAAGSYGLALQLIFITILEGILFKAAFSLFVKAIGIEAAMIIALLLVAYGMYEVFDVGSLSGAPFAKDLLTLSTGLSGGIKAQISAEMQDLQNEYLEFQEYTKAQLEFLETSKDLLDQKHHLSPFVIFGESPEAFYNRTVHSGNIGVVAIGAISSFVDSKLMLPRIQETLGTEHGDM